MLDNVVLTENFQQITPDELPPDIRVSLTNEVGNIGKLAAVLITEKKTGQVRSHQHLGLI